MHVLYTYDIYLYVYRIGRPMRRKAQQLLGKGKEKAGRPLILLGTYEVQPNALRHTTYTLHPTTHTPHSTLHPAPYTHTLHPTTYTPHPTPHTFRPTSYTKHPTPHTPHTPPQTPHTTPNRERVLFRQPTGPIRDVLVDRPRAMGGGIPFSRQPCIYLPRECRPSTHYCRH